MSRAALAALDMAIAITEELRVITACKQPAWTRRAEAKLERELKGLLGTVFDQTVQELLKHKVMPADLMAQRAITGHILGVQEDYARILDRNVHRAALHGREEIAELLPGRLEFDDFAVHTKQALREYVFIASERTISRMAGDVMGELVHGYEGGLGIDQIAENLKLQFDGMMDWELKRVARTEINSFQNVGAYLTEKELGVEYHQWWTAEDERVRETEQADHVYLHAQIVKLGEPFSNVLVHPGDRSGPIEEWINCFPAGTLVVATETERAFSRLYEGDLVTIKTAMGYELTSTPNHPILTADGWVALGSLKKGGNVFCCPSAQVVASRYPDEYDGPAVIEQIYKSISTLSPIQRISCLDVYFHGDGRAGDVNVVTTNRHLVSAFNTILSKHIYKSMLAISSILSDNLTGFRSPTKAKFGLALAANGSMGVNNLLLSEIRRHLRPLQSLSFGTSPGADVVLAQMASNSGSGHIMALSQCINGHPVQKTTDNCFRKIDASVESALMDDGDPMLFQPFGDGVAFHPIYSSNGGRRLASQVTLDYVVDVTVRKTKMPIQVYNLQTRDGWYIANNIVSHNCRCRIVPFFIPEGMRAPTGKPYFYPEDLVDAAEPDKEISIADETFAEQIKSKLAAVDKRDYDSQLRILQDDIEAGIQRHLAKGGDIEGILPRFNAADAPQFLQVKDLQNIGEGFPKRGPKAAEVKQGLSEVSRWLSERVHPDALLDAGSLNKVVYKVKARASYHKDVRTIKKWGGQPEILVHEYGHHLHYQAGGRVFGVTRSFMKQRITGKPLEFIAGSKKEFGYKGFIDHYAGRVYGWENKTSPDGTEIISMGLQYMMRNPRWFYDNDPGHFRLIYALQRGLLR